MFEIELEDTGIYGLVQRKGRDHDPIKPGMWADALFCPTTLEIMSYPVPAEGMPVKQSVRDRTATVMVRTIVGDPTTLREVNLKKITGVFDPSRMNWEPDK